MIRYIVGIDEAGRGPLAGPLSVAAVCLSVQKRLSTKEIIEDICLGVRDSKQLSFKNRDHIFDKLVTASKSTESGFSYSATFVKPATIDRWGMSKALHSAVSRVLSKLNISPDISDIRLDGSLKAPDEYKNQETIIKGDVTEPVISAASVIAKVRRDQAMIRYSKVFPEYGFDRHKGYGTFEHRKAIKKYGPSEIHRQIFLRNVIKSA